MSRDEWEQAMARAVVEGAFRARLLADPVDALTDYGLREHQRRAIQTAQARSLPEFAARILKIAAGLWEPSFDHQGIFESEAW